MPCGYRKRGAELFDLDEELPAGMEAEARARCSRAIRVGFLVPGTCSTCGRTKEVHAHHEDYRFPLRVVWMCRWCHHKLHTTANTVAGRNTAEVRESMVSTLPTLRAALAVEVARAARLRGLDPSTLLGWLVERGLDALRDSRVAVDRARKVLDAATGGR